MTADFTKIQLKIDDLKAKVAQNSISPTYLGEILDDLLDVIEQYDFRQQYKDSVDELKAQITQLQQSVWPLDVVFNVSPLTIEVGVATSIGTSWSVKRDGENVLSQSKVTWISPESSETVTGSQKSTSLSPTAPSSSTFSLSVECQGMVSTVSEKVAAVYPSYFGKVAADDVVTSDIITGLTKVVQPSKAMTQTGISLANQRLCFAYPKSFGILTSVKDGNNFESLTAYTRAEATVNGVAYYVYTMTVPVTARGIKQIYS